MKTIKYKGHTITLRWEFDGDKEAPWEHEDGHGPVSDWTRWCNDEWQWTGYIAEIDGTHFDSCWGIDSDSQSEFENDVFNHAKKRIDNETKEQADAACRDIETVAA